MWSVDYIYIYMIYSYIVYNIHIWIRCHRMAMAGGEPCGLVQMEAMRLGTLPIVAPTGGLKDTVEAH